MNIPFVSDRVKSGAGMAGLGSPRMGSNFTDAQLPPLIVPKAPERTYFLFQQPIDTRDTNIYNKPQCRELYNKVQGEVEAGISTLLRFREADPYKEFVPRTLYELAASGRQAPTAPLNLKW